MVKARNVMFVQQIDYFKTPNIQAIIKELTDVLKPIRFAGILHDKDIGSDGTTVAPHIHLILHFEVDLQTSVDLAKHFNLKALEA